MLAKCQSANITEYYASVLNKGSSELLIVMELMATSVADLVSNDRVLLHCTQPVEHLQSLYAFTQPW